MAIPKISKAGFIKWLSIKGADYIGERSDPCNCPIARYIQFVYPPVYEFYNEISLEVDEDTIRINEKEYAAPAWMSKFIIAIDNSKEFKGDIVPVKVARKIIAAIR